MVCSKTKYEEFHPRLYATYCEVSSKPNDLRMHIKKSVGRLKSLRGNANATVYTDILEVLTFEVISELQRNVFIRMIQHPVIWQNQ